MSHPQATEPLDAAAPPACRRTDLLAQVAAARVVSAIVVLCAVVVGSVGWMVMRQITDGLVKSRVDASVAEARTETATARERLGSAGGTDFDPETQLRLLVENLVARGEVKGFDVVVRGPVDNGSTTGGVRTTPAVDASQRPGGLRRAVEGGEDGLAWTYTRIAYVPSADSVLPAEGPSSGSGRPVVLPLGRRAPTRSTTCSRWRRSSRR